MAMASDITVELLKDIRDEIGGSRDELRSMHAEQIQTNHRLDIVETTLLDLADQQRSVVRYLRAISERDNLEPRVSSLEARVDKLESK
jgi:BMFP domain-containing protein YqiC